MSSTSSRRNEVLFGLIAPVILDISREHLEGFGRITLMRTELSGDGAYLDCIVTCETNGENCPKALRDFEPVIKRTVASAKILGKMPRIRFRYDKRQAGAASVEDIIREIETQYDLTSEN